MTTEPQPDHEDFLKTLYLQRSWCIRTICHKTGCSREHAEDIFIDAVLILEKKKNSGKLEDLKDMKTYLLGTCLTCSKRSYFNDRKLKAAENDVRRYFYDYAQETSFPMESETKGKDELLMAVEFSLKSMGEKCRQVIQLFYYEKKTMTEIANLLGFSSQNSVAVTKFRCFTTLRNKAIALKTQFENEN